MINLTNHRDHPTNPNYTVFIFKDVRPADRFKEYLIRYDIMFELDDSDKQTILFGISNSKLTAANKLNDLVTAEFKPKFIPHKGLRTAVFVFMAMVLLLAIAGYFVTNYGK